MNMPQPEAYGAQPPLELLRSFLDAGGFHESNRLQWKEVHGVNLLSACAPPGGGRHMLSPRLLRNLRYANTSLLLLFYPKNLYISLLLQGLFTNGSEVTIF